MKKFLVAALALASVTAFAQNNYNRGSRIQRQEAAANPALNLANPGVRHMLEFTPETMEAAVLSFDRIKTAGGDADSGTNLKLGVNYAYGIHRYVQIGSRFNYASGLSGADQGESMSLQVGGIVNSNDDFTRAAYVSVFVGAGFQQKFGTGGTRDDLRFGTIAIGKRFPLEAWGIKHIVYSPELALQTVNSTTDESIDYSQSLQFRILQFSVFF